MTATLPAGWKLVPIEPTKEMWAAVNKLDDEMAAGAYDGRGASIEQAWNCLVDAAPTPPATTQDDTLARTGNTAKEQEMYAAGIDAGRAIERNNAAVAGGAQDDAKDEQQAFEAWAKKKKMPLARIGQQYDDFWVDHAWNGWQARAALAAPAAGDARDAARYRWLRHEDREEKHRYDGAIYVRQVQLTSGVITGSAVLVGEDLDAAIDAAVSVSQQQEG